MTDSPIGCFKTEMPQIPGISGSRSSTARIPPSNLSSHSLPSSWSFLWGRAGLCVQSTLPAGRRTTTADRSSAPRPIQAR